VIQGVPHCTSADDVYEGHFIPTGTTVIANLWAIHRDESIYPNASKFDPQRFLNDDGTLNNLQFYSFGFGRRICVALKYASFRVSLVATRPY
jgi:cytochrome P450